MARITPVHSRKVINALQRMGFQVIRQKGSHVHMKNFATGKITTVKHSTDLWPNLIRKILRDINITWEELLKYLMLVQ